MFEKEAEDSFNGKKVLYKSSTKFLYRKVAKSSAITRQRKKCKKMD